VEICPQVFIDLLEFLNESGVFRDPQSVLWEVSDIQTRSLVLGSKENQEMTEITELGRDPSPEPAGKNLLGFSKTSTSIRGIHVTDFGCKRRILQDSDTK
jgi:hypothetical protein